MNRRRYWKLVWHLDDYEPLSDQQNLAMVRGLLARLAGVQPLVAVGVAICADCTKTRHLVRYLTLLLCGDCAGKRQKAARAA